MCDGELEDPEFEGISYVISFLQRCVCTMYVSCTNIGSLTYYSILTDILNKACVFCSFPDEELVFKYAPWALNKNEAFAATVSEKYKLYVCVYAKLCNYQ